MNSYKKMLSKRPQIDEVNWQKHALSDEGVLNKKKVVVAAGTSSGKSLFMTMFLEQYFLQKENKNKKALFIPSGQTNLRLNIEDTFEFFKPTFKYVIAKSSQEFKDAINSDVQVIVCLPKTAEKCMDSSVKLDKFILDEAHTWYFKKTIRSIVKKTKPEQQLLLTGTPAPFILRGGFHMHFVPVMDLYKEGRISNTEVHVVSSAYNFKEEDYNSNHNLNSNMVTKKALASEESFRKVVLGMIRKLKNPIKGMKNANRLTNEMGGMLFNHLDKTIIWVNTVSQANKFAETLRKFKGLQNAVLVSHYENDDDSNLMEKFKSDKDIRVLVTVNRGRMGWSYTELFNAVDFTMTRNLNSILQMMARLFRISKNKPNKKKIFYKVANSKDSGYYTILMKGVLLLLDREWYSKFNGKNFNGMQIPVTVPRRRVINPDGSRTPGRPRTNYNYQMLDIPLDLDFFKSVYSKQDDKFSTVAWTTIEKVRQDLFNIKPWNSRSLDDLKKLAKSFKFYTDFRKAYLHGTYIIRENKKEEEFYSHMQDYVRKANKDNAEYIAKELSKYKGKTYNELCQIKEKYGPYWLYMRAKKLGLDTQVILGNKANFTDEYIIKECKKYKHFTDLINNNYSLGYHLDKNNLRDKYSKYFYGNGFYISKRFTKKNIWDTVKNFDSITSIAKGDSGAYRFIHQNNLIDKVKEFYS